MIFIGTLFGFIRSIWKGLKDPEFRALFFLVVILLLSGTIFYMKAEGWTLLDSIYFCVTTLTTIGFGDPHPITPIGKIFTIFYVILGISILLGFIEKIARGLTARKENNKA
jgi:voltage-gated potassium channel